MNESGLDLSKYLRSHPSIPTTEHLILERALLSRTGDILRPILPGKRWLLIADTTTWSLAGPALVASLERAGVDATPYIIDSPQPIASDQAVADVRAHCQDEAALVALGSGAINDIAKMAAHQTRRPYAVMATAPSMNGYTSAIAALLVDGVKTTQACTPPVACLADLDLIAKAPHRMIAAGLGDLLSKPVSNADWLLAHALDDGPHSGAAADLIAASADLIEGIAAKLPGRDIDAVGRLMASLCLSGLAMCVAGSSAPASGGEHLISHYLDMTHHALGTPNDLHGCQVGVATLATAHFYEKLLALDPATIDVEKRVASHMDWDAYRTIVSRRFGPLAEAVLPHAQTGYPDRDRLHGRLTRLRDQWADLMAGLRPTLRGPAAIRAELEAARGPTTFAALGVESSHARRAILHSKDIRARYTILHLATELGLADEWTAGLERLI